MPDYYETLGLEPHASPEDIRVAYRQLMQIIHPDHHPNKPQAEAWTKRVNAAYEVLSHPGRRAEYDRKRNHTAPETTRRRQVIDSTASVNHGEITLRRSISSPYRWR